MTTVRVRTSGLHQSYGRTQVLHDISLEWGTGVHGLLGRNGAGKTTLLSSLTGFLPVKAGAVQMAGADPGTRAGLTALRRRTTFLPQNFEYPANFTARELVQYALWCRRAPAPASVVSQALERVDLGSQADKPLKKLSGGTLQRAGIAAAIAGDPEVVVLDEPTVGLDPQQRLLLRETLREIGNRAAVVMSTHIVDDVGHLCTDVAVLDGGRIVFDGAVPHLSAKGAGLSGMSELESGYLALIGEQGKAS